MVALLTDLASIESPTNEPRAAGRVLDRLSDEFHQERFQRPPRPRRTDGRAADGPAGRTASGRAAAAARRALRHRMAHGHDEPDACRGRGRPGARSRRIRHEGRAGADRCRAARPGEVGAELPDHPVAIVNTDEETGSPESRRHMVRLARRSVRAFVLEPAFGREGALKTARKAVGEFDS